MQSLYRLSRFIVPWLALVPLAVSAQKEDLPLSQEEERKVLAYGLGYNVAGRLVLDYPNLDVEQFIKGLNAAFNGEKPPYEADLVKSVLAQSRAEVAQRREKEMRQVAQDNRLKSQKFLEENSKKTEVNLLDSGIQYQVLREGDGIKPKMGDVVRIHFEGKLIDGTVFDDTRSGGDANGVEMKLTTKGSMTGALEGITRMRRGAVWRLFIPPEQGFGSVGSNKVGPNQVLIYDVELLAVKKADD